ncbi:hypothetical protein BPAE_0148g00220 [Botrytis paeoniae]|uniref:Uncharacterized protein n=1 Tax=Botrytis paeoniae TaxID=278948 RepID=A0A4Z1FJM1_9HELO|nr:hypothetical protein BPAE_0148g00220 [Botrytis paeoniae]
MFANIHRYDSYINFSSQVKYELTGCLKDTPQSLALAKAGKVQLHWTSMTRIDKRRHMIRNPVIG